MRTMLTIGLLALAGVAWADERPLLRDGETPRATDLFKADKLAKKAESRLRTPPSPRAGWRHGADGWGSDAPPSPPSNVTIHVGGTGRRRAKP